MKERCEDAKGLKQCPWCLHELTAPPEAKGDGVPCWIWTDEEGNRRVQQYESIAEPATAYTDAALERLLQDEVESYIRFLHSTGRLNLDLIELAELKAEWLKTRGE